DVSGNYFNNNPATLITSMSSLAYLNLSRNYFTGPLPSLPSASAVLSLDLSSNYFFGRGNAYDAASNPMCPSEAVPVNTTNNCLSYLVSPPCTDPSYPPDQPQRPVFQCQAFCRTNFSGSDSAAVNEQCGFGGGVCIATATVSATAGTATVQYNLTRSVALLSQLHLLMAHFYVSFNACSSNVSPSHPFHFPVAFPSPSLPVPLSLLSPSVFFPLSLFFPSSSPPLTLQPHSSLPLPIYSGPSSSLSSSPASFPPTSSPLSASQPASSPSSLSPPSLATTPIVLASDSRVHSFHVEWAGEQLYKTHVKPL
ncbi:unnamed protein product, partial [Closterium sp. Naga37s-1]